MTYITDFHIIDQRSVSVPSCNVILVYLSADMLRDGRLTHSPQFQLILVTRSALEVLWSFRRCANVVIFVLFRPCSLVPFLSFWC